MSPGMWRLDSSCHFLLAYCRTGGVTIDRLGAERARCWSGRQPAVGVLDGPPMLRLDLDPGPGVGFERVREAAGLVREVLANFGLRGWPKTSGSRGIHV